MRCEFWPSQGEHPEALIVIVHAAPHGFNFNMTGMSVAALQNHLQEIAEWLS